MLLSPHIVRLESRFCSRKTTAAAEVLYLQPGIFRSLRAGLLANVGNPMIDNFVDVNEQISSAARLRLREVQNCNTVQYFLLAECCFASAFFFP